MYDNFIRGLTTASRTTEKDLDYVKRVFGDDYKKDLDLGSEVKDSKIRQLVPLGRLMERLNLDLETIQEFLFRVRDQRCAQLAGTQGHRSQVTGRDLTFVKEELQSLMWTTLKRARDPMLTENAKKRKRSGPLSKEFVDDDADSPLSKELVDDEPDEPEERDLEEDLDAGRSPTRSPPARRLTPASPAAQPRNPPVSLPAKKRNTYKVPKNGKDLLRCRVAGFGPAWELVKFGEWSDSAYVHGHAREGRFAFDDDKGSVYANRLVGFHDANKRHFGVDYLNSWILLPLGPRKLLENTWIFLSQMLNQRILAFDDARLRRQQPGKEGICGLLLYPNAQQKVIRCIDPRIQAQFHIRLANGSKGPLTPFKSIVQRIDETEDPLVVNKRFYAEHFLADAVELPRCVEEELGFGLFAADGCGQQLRAPRMDIPEMQEAVEAVGNTMPIYYGEPSGGSTSQSMHKHSKTVELAGVRHGGNWTQPLAWHRGNPQRLTKNGIYERRQVQQVEWLEKEAQEYFGARRCIGLVGSFRVRDMPICGSLMWSLLYRGERLVLLWGPHGTHDRAIAVIQKAGDLIVIPPGHDFGWYNIRSCVSDEGYFYVPKFFDSYRIGDTYAPGTLEILAIWPSGEREARDSREIIAYFVLVNIIVQMTRGPRGPRFKLLLRRLVGLLSMPVFAYLPRVRETPLEPDALDNCTRVLAWTAPFAALALYRCTQLYGSDTPIDDEADSLTLDEADDAIVTDMEEFEGSPEPPMVPTHISDSGVQEEGEGSQKGLEVDDSIPTEWLAFSMSAIHPDDLNSD
ncbi:hypothetical protein QFC21_005590 [Naganishia friedmannii]|uniref:Uncharacterized protein n=1 Tax=Naganishia friedmannii TaxID=89922 RepID=A0ACC2V9H4_9TREE|nr:hypothetical protein QFC21_005590 [Naganishia friedmannii]